MMCSVEKGNLILNEIYKLAYLKLRCVCVCVWNFFSPENDKVPTKSTSYDTVHRIRVFGTIIP